MASMFSLADLMYDPMLPVQCHRRPWRVDWMKMQCNIVESVESCITPCFIFSFDLYNLLTVPFVEAMQRHSDTMRPVINYQTLGLFFARVKLSFFGAIMVAFPVVAWQLYAFVAPGLYKRERQITSAQAANVQVKGRDVINLCANNYLGLADHPALINAAQAAMETQGFGMASVRFICGTQDRHRQLERHLSLNVRIVDSADTRRCCGPAA